MENKKTYTEAEVKEMLKMVNSVKEEPKKTKEIEQTAKDLKQDTIKTYLLMFIGLFMLAGGFIGSSIGTPGRLNGFLVLSGFISFVISIIYLYILRFKKWYRNG